MSGGFFNGELDGDYFQGASRFLQQTIVKVMVEANDDIVLWQQLSDEAIIQTKANIQFEISPIFVVSETNSDGKGELLKLIDKCDKHFVLAMDSDYDFVANGHNERSKLINNHSHILQTYCYALENFRSVPSVIENLITQASKNGPLQDEFRFADVMTKLGQLVYPLLTLLLYSKKQSLLEDINVKLQALYQTMSFIGFGGDFKAKFAQISDVVERQMSEISNSVDINQLHECEEYLQWQQQIDDHFAEQWFLMVRGHDLLDKVVKPLFKHIAVYRTRVAFAKLSARQSDDKADKISQFQSSQTSQDLLIDNNTQFDRATVYPKIISNLKSLIDQH